MNSLLTIIHRKHLITKPGTVYSPAARGQGTCTHRHSVRAVRRAKPALSSLLYSMLETFFFRNQQMTLFQFITVLNLRGTFHRHSSSSQFMYLFSCLAGPVIVLFAPQSASNKQKWYSLIKLPVSQASSAPPLENIAATWQGKTTEGSHPNLPVCFHEYSYISAFWPFRFVPKTTSVFHQDKEKHDISSLMETVQSGELSFGSDPQKNAYSGRKLRASNHWVEWSHPCPHLFISTSWVTDGRTYWPKMLRRRGEKGCKDILNEKQSLLVYLGTLGE